MHQTTTRSAAGEGSAYAVWYCLSVACVLCRRAGVYKHHILSCSSLFYNTSSSGVQNEKRRPHDFGCALSPQGILEKSTSTAKWSMLLERKLLIVTSNTNDECASNSMRQNPMTLKPLRYRTLKTKHPYADTFFLIKTALVADMSSSSPEVKGHSSMSSPRSTQKILKRWPW
jgi:hypothetical protein